jgi:hypothetical protein
MARLSTAPRKRSAAKAATPRAEKSALGRLDGLSPEQKVARLLEEREALVARVRELEAELRRQTAKHADVADRIAWALDTLKDLIATKP